jgi:hypothetical protein
VKFGPSTSNADLAEAMDHLLHLGIPGMSDEHFSIFQEAATRIRELDEAGDIRTDFG